MASDNGTSRRSFLNKLLAGGFTGLIAAIAYPVIRFIVPPEAREANVNQVKLDFTRQELEAEPQKSKTFKFGRSLGLILLTPNGQLKAMAATCTHLDCTVQHRPDLGIVWCACHNGRYDLDGKNISGPPPRPLESYTVNEIDGDIFVVKGTA